MNKKRGIKLRNVISLLVLVTAIFISIVNWYSSSIVIKNSLSENILTNNYDYANKVTLNTTVLLNDMKKNIKNLSDLVGKEKFSQHDMDRWLAANSNYFNSIFITDDRGIVQLMSPQKVGNMQAGTKIETDLMKQSLSEQKPFISSPYKAQSGNLVLLVSHPIVDENEIYKGAVNGIIYLENESSLKNLLIEHDIANGSQVMVVDPTGTIVYHTDSSRVKESVSKSKVVQNVLKGESGK